MPTSHPSGPPSLPPLESLQAAAVATATFAMG